MPAPTSRRVRFGDFELDLTTGELRSTNTADGNNVLLREQVFRVLRVLLEREGKIVTREEIKSRLWANDTVVDFDHCINATVKTLRRALAGCGKMRFPNPCGYYRVFGARDGSGFPTAIQRDSVAELGIFPQPARGFR
jgi:hypothetical protein